MGDFMDMAVMNGFRVLDLRECVSKLMKIGRTEEEANTEVDVMLMITENANATKAEVKEVDHRVDMVEVKLDVIEEKIDALDKKLSNRIDGLDKRMDGLDKRMDGLDKRMDRLESKMSWGFGIIISIMISVLGGIFYILIEYAPVIAKLVEMKAAIS